MKPALAALLLWSALVGGARPTLADTDPLRAFSPESIAGAKKLASTLAGTYWVYHLHGISYSFRFGPTGRVEAFKQWPDVYWRVVSPNEVLLNHQMAAGTITFVFNGDTTSFECLDWHDGAATGSRAGTKPAPEDAGKGGSYFGSGSP